MKSDDVAAYLKRNPAFFSENSEVLADLTLHHANPFHQRQLEVLRERHSREKARYDMVVESARLNQALEQSLHEFSCILLSESGWAAATLEEEVGSCFNLEGVRLCLEGDGRMPEGEFGLLKDRVRHGGSICDDRVSSALLAGLFGEGNAVSSCAFIPLSTSYVIGVLILGSAESGRFQPGMGVIYLDRIGELLSAILSRPPE